jgi:hypothetical protein
VLESTLSHCFEIFTAAYILKKKLLSTGTDFWRKDSRGSHILKVRIKVIREQMGLTQHWKYIKLGR